jgi:hypothetical protein
VHDANNVASTAMPRILKADFITLFFQGYRLFALLIFQSIMTI